eukprot:c9667_g1_i2.p1 GENE.c9667_g1_i2~~c9667_g1_i2.p1  ORF type:complete len:454 (+),score=91.93 c9667_g1_i2:494-1855(+)
MSPTPSPTLLSTQCPTLDVPTTLSSPPSPTPSISLGSVLHDCELNHLVRLLNNIDFSPFSSISKQSHPMETFAELFVNALTPWIISEPAHDLLVSSRPQSLSYDCQSPRHSHVMNGKPLSDPRFIIDIVAVGYNIDMLEIRLLETFDIVDVFVFYESRVHPRGGNKPLYFDLVRNTPRFSRFSSKILYATPPPSSNSNLGSDFAINFIKDSATHPLLAPAFATPSRAYIIQNEAEEMINGEALLHFKHCELRRSVLFPLGTGALSYKKTFHWLQTTHDMFFMTGGTLYESMNLKDHVWLAGPTLMPLSMAQNAGNTHRHHEPQPFKNHLGIASAIDITWQAEPVQSWITLLHSIAEDNIDQFFSSTLLTAGRTHTITPSMIVSDSIKPWCDQAYRMRHYQTLGPDSERVIRQSWPWAVRDNPARYCFLLPQDETTSMVVGKVTSNPNWVSLCG